MLFMTRIAESLHRWTTPTSLQPVFHSPQALKAALDRERARSDRSGTVFSFLTFTGPEGGPRASLEHVISVLKGRLRTTDEFGYLDGRRIGVVLLDAPATQAWLIADAVLGDWPPELPRPACDVFSYPNREPIVARASPEERPGDEVNVNRPGSIAASAQLARPIQRMEPLFSRGMPAWKRGVDIIGSTVGLVLAAPVIGLAVIAIRLSSPGPAIFRQERAGHCGVPFTIFKLRTMQLDADARKQELSGQNEQDGPAFKITNDPRVTPLGRYLRKTSIDELPQLWNVLRGEMSLVGPRPLPVAEAEACEGWQHRRVDWHLAGGGPVAHGVRRLGPHGHALHSRPLDPE
jgi:lipopolysaccharide/colanic/teichoic acid biosynthesis glycosyltransferase